MHFARLILVLGLAVALGGCASRGDRSGDDALLKGQISEALDGMRVEEEQFTPDRSVAFTVTSFERLDGWFDDDHGAALAAFRLSCAKIRGLRDPKVIGGFANSLQDWSAPCAAADSVEPGAARAFFEFAFRPVRIAPGETALVTSYYEPELRASRVAQGAFRHPIYAKPAEVVSKGGEWGVRTASGLTPFLSRGQIDAGGLIGRNLEIAWLEDPVDVFFLQIQGSGRLRFADGSTMRVGYAGKNGHPYSSVAKAMVDRGLTTLNKASADRIRDYVRANPQAGMDLLAENKSFVFFRPVEGLDDRLGPIGALGVQLLDQRAIAVDRRYTPLGAPVWLEAETPLGSIRRLVVAQDTGTAIKGPQRADFFWGTGVEAGLQAGRMKSPGAMTTLLPNRTVERLTAAGS